MPGAALSVARPIVDFNVSENGDHAFCGRGPGSLYGGIVPAFHRPTALRGESYGFRQWPLM